MKRILITGLNSYVGNSFDSYMKQYDGYKINKISVRGNEWKNLDFSKYDVILHVAGIVHKKNISEEEYFSINRDLTTNVAQKAKDSGVSLFIFLSTMAIFGVDSGVIDNNTSINPNTLYGKSKRAAEINLLKLKSDDFKVSIVRPPMIYGKGCPGNYKKLSKLASITPVFPKIYNQRSMIFIDNLNNFLKLIVDANLEGNFHPQNKNYICTSFLVEKIKEIRGSRIWMIPIPTIINKYMKKKSRFYKKIFGDLFYSNGMSGYPNQIFDNLVLNYDNNDYHESILNTEKSD
ncbi:NAD-dependent epimerase/dehydratase family protein [Enterococcus italicus]